MRESSLELLSESGSVPNPSAFSAAVAASRHPPPLGQDLGEDRAAVLLVRNPAHQARLSRPSIVLVTLVRWTCSRSPILPSGSDAACG